MKLACSSQYPEPVNPTVDRVANETFQRGNVNIPVARQRSDDRGDHAVKSEFSFHGPFLGTRRLERISASGLLLRWNALAKSLTLVVDCIQNTGSRQYDEF